MYGVSPLIGRTVRECGLEPVMSFEGRILTVRDLGTGGAVGYGADWKASRDSRIGVVNVGYADGYSRKLSNKGKVIINGKLAPVAGRVCMDAFMVDVTNIPKVSQNSEAILIGSKGKNKVTADDIAVQTGTIPYEVLTLIGKRVKRVYRKS